MSAEENLQNETAAEKKKRLAAEKKAELEKQKQDEANKAKKKPKSLKDLKEDYGLKKINGLFVPAYFHRKERYAENAEETIDVYHAKNFLFGMEIFAEQGSASAKITYIGPNRRYSLHNVKLGMREARPSHNNWKTHPSRLLLFKSEGEHNSKVKDPKVIRDLLTSQGGKKNFKIRFVLDKEFTQEEVKKKVFATDPVRLKNLNYRVKLDHTKLGIKPIVRDKKEAQLLLKDIKAQVKDKKIDHVIKYLQKEVKKYLAIEAEQKKEAKKD